MNVSGIDAKPPCLCYCALTTQLCICFVCTDKKHYVGARLLIALGSVQKRIRLHVWCIWCNRLFYNSPQHHPSYCRRNPNLEHQGTPPRDPGLGCWACYTSICPEGLVRHQLSARFLLGLPVIYRDWWKSYFPVYSIEAVSYFVHFVIDNIHLPRYKTFCAEPILWHLRIRFVLQLVKNIYFWKFKNINGIHCTSYKMHQTSAEENYNFVSVQHGQFETVALILLSSVKFYSLPRLSIYFLWLYWVVTNMLDFRVRQAVIYSSKNLLQCNLQHTLVVKNIEHQLLFYTARDCCKI